MKRELMKRLAFGALCGLAAMAPVTVLFPYSESSNLTALCGTVQLAGLARLVAGSLWGAAVGAGTLFWQRERGSFLTNSLWNYLLTCAAFVLWGWICLGLRPGALPLVLWGVFTALYVIGWVVRWLTCHRDVDRIRAGLGLPETPPSPLRWRESLPYAVLLAALFLALRPIVSCFDGVDVPLLTALVLPWLAYPFAAAVTGFGAGVRHGVCPLVPEAAVLAILPNLLYTDVPYSWPMAAVYGLLALAGNLLGAVVRRKKNL
ncbi:MAG: DUF3021 domain-containing protein [Oscillibacter sp.]|nr:DUF3021 domain-containing protein [Oscillibacter sp.]